MKIAALQTFYPQSNLVKQKFNKDISRCSNVQEKECQFFVSPLNFKANSVAYLKAKEYLAKEFPNVKSRDLFRYDFIQGKVVSVADEITEQQALEEVNEIIQRFEISKYILEMDFFKEDE